MKTTVRFEHGLGDAVNFAHSLIVYQKRGHTFKVACSPDKAPIFQAVGAETCGLDDCPAPDHPWHNPASGAWAARPGETIGGNKAGENWGVSPMPNIGHPRNLWPELVSAYVDAPAQLMTLEAADRVDRIFTDLEANRRPVVLLHANANTSPQRKDLSPGWLARFYGEVIDRTDATILVLDWDDRTFTPASARVRHLTREWGWKPDLPGLYALMQAAHLFVGVDSGPLHFLRFTQTLGLGLWRGHNPTAFAIPRPLTLHVAPPAYADDNARKRHEFNTITDYGVGGAELCPGFCAEQVKNLLGVSLGSGLLHGYGTRARVPGAMLQYFLKRTRGESGPNHLIDRQKTFADVLARLSRVPDPVVIETGSIRSPEDWSGAGFFGYLIGFYLHARGVGQLHTVELDPAHAGFARTWTAPFGARVTTHTGDSRRFLYEWRHVLGRKIDLLYSDSADVGTDGYQDVCLEEVQNATIGPARLAPPLILIDDTFWERGRWGGKGGRAVPYLIEKGWRVEYSGYQTLLTAPP